jgi:hypothetical protein
VESNITKAANFLLMVLKRMERCGSFFTKVITKININQTVYKKV